MSAASPSPEAAGGIVRPAARDSPAGVTLTPAGGARAPRRAKWGELEAALLPLLRRGARGPECVTALPGFSPASVHVTLSKLRKRHGIEVVRGGPGLILPRNIHEALRVEAVAGGRYTSANELAVRLLAIIVKDNLFEALLDDEPRGQR